MTNQPNGHDDWTVWDPDRGNLHRFDTRGEAESKIDMADELGIPAELYPPGESPEEMYHAETGDADPEDHTESVRSETESDPEPEPETDGGKSEGLATTGMQPETVEFVREPAQTDSNVGSQTAAGDLTRLDPKEILLDRDWMLTTITHPNGDKTKDLNKRGTQVIAELLGAYPSAQLLEYDPTGEPAYAVVKAWVTDPETGREYAAHGEARSSESNVSASEVVRQAETRAKKRAIKWVSASGAKVLIDGVDE